MKKQTLAYSQEQALGFLIKYGFKETRERAIEKLINHNINLINFVIGKKFNSKVREFGFEDIFSAGMEGLYKAARRFDYSLGYRFSTYAFRGISNQIYNEISRIERKRAREITNSIKGEELSCSGDIKEIFNQDLYSILNEKISGLSENERKVINLKYYQSYTLREISKKMGVSHEKIRQIQKKAIRNLRDMFLGREIEELVFM